MATNKTVLENIELSKGGQISVYIASSSSNRVAITITVGESESCIWVTPDEAKELADKLQSALSEVA